MKNGMKWFLLVCLIAVGGEAVAKSGVYVLKSDSLKVVVDSAFPRVISYTDRESGAVFYGQNKSLSEVLLNGETHTPTIKSMGPEKLRNRKSKTAAYKLVFPEAGNVEMIAMLSVEGPVVTLSITDIKDNDDFRIGSVEIPNHSLLSIRSTQSDATLATATINADKSKRMDEFTKITADLPKEEKRSNAAYAILSTKQLAATLVNNSAYDIDKDDVLPEGVKKDKSVELGNGRVRVAVEASSSGATASLSSGEWTYRAEKSDLTEDALWCKVIITGDRNDDGQIDWQDGAIAYRDIMVDPYKWEMTKKRVAQHIVFNFGSAAGEPFLRTLDNVKRVHYATDGLGQFILMKGYQSEGHDSAHPDYGGNIGRRQGGKEEMNYLVDVAQEWNAEMGVHINCQEAYPEAYTFEHDMVYTNMGGWNWIDQSYVMNHRWDITSGAFEKRVQHLKSDVPGLDFIYMDIYWGDGWLSQEFERVFRRAGLGISTELPQMLEHAATWSHWSTDITYGPDTLRGVNSHIIRFIRNHQKDMYLVHPLLGHAELGDFEGWQGRTDFNQFLGKLYRAALPSKYLQHFEIMKWTDHEVLLSGDVRITDESGTRQFFHKGRKVLEGSAYLLPWEPTTEAKLYHWNGEGGETTWKLPASWSVNNVKVYQLTDTGRLPAVDVPVVEGKVTLTAAAKTPYVVYREEAPAQREPNWGEGSLVKDPGFYDKSLANWSLAADEGVVSIETDDHVRTALTFNESEEPAMVSQFLTGLKPGTYSASVWVEVEGVEQDTTTASSTEVANPPAHAIDGNPQTRWCASSGAAGEWLKLDLGESTELSGARIAWEKASNNLFAVAVSADGAQWQTVVEKQPASGDEQIVEFSAPARYLRLDIDGSNDAYASVRILEALNAEGERIELPAKESPVRKASLVAVPEGGEGATVWTDSSPFINTVKNSHWNRSRTQLMRVLFDVPERSGMVRVGLMADPGTSRIRFDNVRVVPTVRCEKEGYDFYQDFENVGEGWFPFVKGTVGGVEDPRTHLSERHEPYTQKGWNGKLIDDVIEGDWSLKAHEERIGSENTPGMIYRTLSQTLRFEPGKKYEVSFDYQCAYDGEYEFLIGSDEAGWSSIVTNIPFAKTDKTERFVVAVEPGEKKSVWVGVQRMMKNDRKRPEADLVVDNLGVRELD